MDFDTKYLLCGIGIIALMFLGLAWHSQQAENSCKNNNIQSNSTCEYYLK